MALYQTQPDRKLRAKALAKEYGIGGHSHDYLDGSRGFVNHDGRGMEFDHYPEHKKFTLSWTQVEKYIDLMVQSDRYLTDREKEHYTPPSPVSAKPFFSQNALLCGLPLSTARRTLQNFSRRSSSNSSPISAVPRPRPCRSFFVMKKPI